jgi:hypothetical protein
MRFLAHFIAASVLNALFVYYFVVVVNDLSFMHGMCDTGPEMGGYSIFGSGAYFCYVRPEAGLFQLIYGNVLALVITAPLIEFLRISWMAYRSERKSGT